MSWIKSLWDKVVNKTSTSPTLTLVEEVEEIEDELVEEIAGLPFMSNDDLVDSTVMALLRFRQGGVIRVPTDEWEDEAPYYHKREYY